MPITRRRRAINPPEQAEQTNITAERTEQVVDTAAADNIAETPQNTEPQTPVTPAYPEQPAPAPFAATQPPVTPVLNNEREHSAQPQTPPATPRPERRHERHDFGPGIESGRRTARGELFRRPPQIPPAAQPQAAPVVSPVPLQPPSHEISLPLGNLLHLAYNPGYTGSDEARSALLQQLENESKAGGRARCWSCGSLAIVYNRWNTRSKNFGEVGVAFCEICGVWSVM
jgi:hypothetical protein